MSPSNATIADLLRRYAAVVSLEGANRFKVKAYRRAAETIEGLESDLADLAKKGFDLTELPGVGKAISDIISEILHTGTLERLGRGLAQLPPEMAELAMKPALDPKKVTRVYKKLGIGTLRELKDRLEKGQIGAQLGARIEYHVRQGLDERPRVLLHDALPIAERIERRLCRIHGVTNVSQAGSVRRRQDTVGDLNFLVASEDPASVFEQFAASSSVLTSKQDGKSQCAFTLSAGLVATLRVTSADEWGLSLIQATGSALHLADLGAKAAVKKLRLEHGGMAKIKLAREADVYTGLGLDFIEPELREGAEEVAAAARKMLPHLIEQAQIRGDLHMHTTASDGANGLAEMVEAAQARGYEYIAITDHSQSLKITNGLTEKRLAEQIRAIDKINSRLKGFRVLKSAEVDILQDGKLDYSQAMLKELDCTICSIHSRFGLSKEQQTDRILRAMDNRYFHILGHATGRLLLKRQGYDLDVERIIEHAKSRGCFFEINSSPDRLDLSDVNARAAKEAGVMIAINTDAHSIRELENMAAGIRQARRAWLEPVDVLNTLSLAQLLRRFQR